MQIKVKNVSFSYRNAGEQAIKNFSSSIERGQFIGVIGLSGSGKTTLIQLLAGLIKPTAGEIFFNGQKINYPLPADIRRAIGVLFQEPERQLFERTVFDDVAFWPRQCGLSEAEVVSVVEQALAAVNLNLKDYGPRLPFKLSGGEMRKVAIAGVLTMQPSVILLDEPLVGLDSQGQGTMLELMRKWQRQGRTVLVCSHDLGVVAELANRVWVLDKGQLIMDASPREVFSQLSLLESLGLGVHALGYLYHALKQRNRQLSCLPLTTKEAVQEILALVGGVPAVVLEGISQSSHQEFALKKGKSGVFCE